MPPASPHIRASGSVSLLMRRVLWALLPGTILYVLLFGPAVLIHLALAMISALLLEAWVLRLRARPIRPALGDGSALVAASLFALSISPFAAWWVSCIGMAFAIVVVKQLYGGLGYNLFNPAMSAYLLVWLCFPLHFAHWPTLAAQETPGLFTSLAIIFTGSAADLDALSGATALGHSKLELSRMTLRSEINAPEVYGLLSGRGWEWINAAFALGGLGLVASRSIDWRIPLAVLGSLFLISGFFYLYDGERHAPPLFHLFGGGVMLGAFFIATEPVSGVTSTLGRWIYGSGIGVLIYLLRVAGYGADGVALTIVLMNCAAPFIDACCQPRRQTANG